ncbi:UDP-N-acetylmuramate--L-alanine ligase [Bizionia saleffrena]|uniref:UDP-N-acetylmuramate--L-alanine ligase n=1 Tax=Bizionia saleffrena TaxID=291189 RepID=A0A8H2QKC0_9FLAO|nr:UDP-N-acetylmuramate--L-alanine ligase [Bizionia saleffrena]TYB78077.1 UDP-N-acetylmuramate--L-alanine ligase [Bizionia saleffrena]
MNLERIHNVYFIGIGGIGMSALARYFKSSGKNVAGYDKTETDITKSLIDSGIEVHYEDSISNVDFAFYNTSTTLVVYTPAVPKDHRQLAYFNHNRYDILKRSEVLGLITKNSFCLAVAGTHGKTTTTSILGHILYQNDVKLTAFLGGISENYNSNLIENGNEVSVVEADEFDRSFLTLSPDIACITSMDADHLDVYGDASELIKSFEAFAGKLKPDGKLFVKNGLPLNGITYGVEDDADYSAQNVTIKNGGYVFDFKTPTTVVKNVAFTLPGRHNLSNAVIALAMATEYGVSVQDLTGALATYKGVKRRFTYQIQTKDCVFIDDYAHHPAEINAVHQAVREMYPNDKVLAVFQPHLFSRTRDFGNAFADSLAQFDEVLLLDVYPARELPIEGVTSQWLLNMIKNNNKQLVSKEDLIEKIKKSKARVVLTIGAGDIGAEVSNIKKALSGEN